MKKIQWSKFSKLFIMVAIFALLSVLRTEAFLSAGNIANVLWSISVVGIMTCGTIFVFLIGGIDLSIGSLCGLTAVAIIKTVHFFNDTDFGVFMGILCALGVGILAGFLHGIIITRFNIPAFLVTFASQNIFYGLSIALTGNKIIDCTSPASFTAIGSKKFFGLPMPIYIMFLMAVLSWFVLSKTSFGRSIYSIGGNVTASALSGINTTRRQILCYCLSGFTTAIGGIVLASMTRQCMWTTGQGYETEVITAGVIGGVSLLGGEGTVPGAIFGAILIGLLNNGLNLLSVPVTHNGLVKGIVIITAVAFDAFNHRDQAKKRVSIFKRKAKTQAS